MHCTDETRNTLKKECIIITHSSDSLLLWHQSSLTCVNSYTTSNQFNFVPSAVTKIQISPSLFHGAALPRIICIVALATHSNS